MGLVRQEEVVKQKEPSGAECHRIPARRQVAGLTQCSRPDPPAEPLRAELVEVDVCGKEEAGTE